MLNISIYQGCVKIPYSHLLCINLDSDSAFLINGIWYHNSCISRIGLCKQIPFISHGLTSLFLSLLVILGNFLGVSWNAALYYWMWWFRPLVDFIEVLQSFELYQVSKYPNLQAIRLIPKAFVCLFKSLMCWLFGVNVVLSVLNFTSFLPISSH